MVAQWWRESKGDAGGLGCCKGELGLLGTVVAGVQADGEEDKGGMRWCDKGKRGAPS